MVCVDIVTVSYVFSKAIWTTSTFSRSIRARFSDLEFSYLEFITQKIISTVFQPQFLKMNFRGLFYTLIALADAFVLIPSTTVQRTVLNQRRNLSGKKQEHNNLLDALKRSMSKNSSWERVKNRCHFWLGIGGPIWLLRICIGYTYKV